MRVARVLIALAAGALLFAAGVAVGQALQDTSIPAGTQQHVRTLKPLQLAPARVTVTVTTRP